MARRKRPRVMEPQIMKIMQKSLLFPQQHGSFSPFCLHPTFAGAPPPPPPSVSITTCSFSIPVALGRPSVIPGARDAFSLGPLILSCCLYNFQFGYLLFQITVNCQLFMLYLIPSFVFFFFPKPQIKLSFSNKMFEKLWKLVDLF